MSFGGQFGGRFAGALLGRAPGRSFDRYRFDTRLSKPLRGIIQDGAVSMLSPLDGANGGYLAALEPTAQTIRGNQDEEAFGMLADQLGGRTPAILVGCGDADYSIAGDVQNWKGTLTVPVYLIVNSAQSRELRQTGNAESYATATADPGIFVMLEHTRQLLAGQLPGDVGNSIKHLRPSTERQLWAGEDVEIWEQTYIVVISYSLNLKRDISLELKQIETYTRLADQQIDSDTPIVETNTVIP